MNTITTFMLPAVLSYCFISLWQFLITKDFCLSKFCFCMIFENFLKVLSINENNSFLRIVFVWIPNPLVVFNISWFHYYFDIRITDITLDQVGCLQHLYRFQKNLLLNLSYYSKWLSFVLRAVASKLVKFQGSLSLLLCGFLMIMYSKLNIFSFISLILLKMISFNLEKASGFVIFFYFSSIIVMSHHSQVIIQCVFKIKPNTSDQFEGLKTTY